MDTSDHSTPHGADVDDAEAVPGSCAACAAAMQSADRRALSFLLLDQLTVPLVGCEEHVSRFASICGYTTAATAEVIHHRPAGGISCPSCHLVPYSPTQLVVPVDAGAVGVLACPDHRAALLGRFQAGLETRHQLTADPTGTESQFTHGQW